MDLLLGVVGIRCALRDMDVLSDMLKPAGKGLRSEF